MSYFEAATSPCCNFTPFPRFPAETLPAFGQPPTEEASGQGESPAPAARVPAAPRTARSPRIALGCSSALDPSRSGPPRVATAAGRMPRASQSMRLPSGTNGGGAIPLASSSSSTNSLFNNRSDASSSSVNASSLLGRSVGVGAGDRAATAGWTPLRDDYFAPPLLSQKEKSYLVRKACEAAQELVERARSADGPIAWRHVEKVEDVQVYVGQPRGASASTGSMSMCGVMSVPGTVKEVAALFDLSTTRQMKDAAARNGPHSLFYDAVVLHTLAPRSREKPLHQVTAKWMVIKTPRGVEDRDFCYLECQDKFIDSLGRKGWVLCMHSIKLPGCDDLQREFGLVRGSVYHSGLIVVEAEQRRGYVDVIHVLQMNLKKNAAMPPAFLRDRVLTVGRIRAMMRAKRLNEQRYLSDLELVPKKYRSRCTVCQDSFSLLLLRKLNCRKCGEVVCGACSKEFTIDSARIRTDAAVKLRICMRCYQVVTAAPQSADAVLETPRASTSLSFLEYCDDVQRASFITQGSVASDRFDPHRRPQQQQQRPTKIFLQSMRRPSSSSSAFMPSQSTGTYGPGGPSRYTLEHSRGDVPPLGRGASSRASERIGPDFRLSQSMGVMHQQQQSSARYSMMGYQQPSSRPPPSPASIFDRPVNNAAAQRRQNNNSVASNSSNLGGGGSNGMGATTTSTARSRLQELASQEMKLNAQSGYMAPRVSYDFPSSPLDMDALRTTEASIAIPPSPVAPSYFEPPATVPSPPTRRVTPEPHAQRDRATSDSSDSSTGSIDIDSYEADGSPDPGTDVATKSPGTVEDASPVRKDSDSSNGFGGQMATPKAKNVPPRASPSPRQHRISRDEAEETKADEFSTTPALPPPSPSAHVSTKEVLERQSTADATPFFGANLTTQGQKPHHHVGVTAYDEEEDFIDHDEEDDSGSEEGDIDKDFVNDDARRPSANTGANPVELRNIQQEIDEEARILNTAGCDMRYLDDDMRQFHDQSLFVGAGQQNASNQGSVYQSDGTMSDVSGSAYNYGNDAPTSPTRTRDRISRDRSAFYGRPPSQAGSSVRSAATSVASSRRPPPRPITPVNGRNESQGNARPSVRWAPSPSASPRESYRQSQQERTPRQPATAANLNPSTVSTTPTEMRFAVNGSLVSTADARRQREEEDDLSFRRTEVRRSSGGGNEHSTSTDSYAESLSPRSATLAAAPLRANGSPSVAERPSRREPPAYLPNRFQSPGEHSPLGIGNGINGNQAPPPVPQRNDAESELAERLDGFSIDFSSSFETNQAKNARREAERGEIQHVQFRAPPEGSVLDAVPEATTPQQPQSQPAPRPVSQDVPAAPSSSSGDESDDDQLLSARVLFKSFGDTDKLASLVGNTRDDPRFQRRFSQLQRNLQRASADSSDDDD